MMRANRFGPVGVVAASVLVAGLFSSAGANWRSYVAGPPMVCHEFQIGDAKSLPVKLERSSSYVKTQLEADVLAILAPGSPVIVRMETIRRAVSHGAQEPSVLHELFSALQTRVLDAEARNASTGDEWFDAGYFAATWFQLREKNAPAVGVADGCVGYAWLLKALEASKGSAEMQFGAALAVHPAMNKGTNAKYERHMAAAATGADKNPLLEQNVRLHCKNWNESYDDLKKNGAASADTRKR